MPAFDVGAVVGSGVGAVVGASVDGVCDGFVTCDEGVSVVGILNPLVEEDSELELFFVVPSDLDGLGTLEYVPSV